MYILIIVFVVKVVWGLLGCFVMSCCILWLICFIFILCLNFLCLWSVVLLFVIFILYIGYILKKWSKWLLLVFFDLIVIGWKLFVFSLFCFLNKLNVKVIVFCIVLEVFVLMKLKLCGWYGCDSKFGKCFRNFLVREYNFFFLVDVKSLLWLREKGFF